MLEAQMNIFDPFTVDNMEVDAVCITTNGYVKTNGKAVMGAGTAQQARTIWRSIDEILGTRLALHGNHVHYLLKDNDVDVLSFPVKHAWSAPAELALIERSAKELVEFANQTQYKRVLLPRPGCGNGNLNWWEDVKPIIKPILDGRFTVVYL